MSNFKRNNHVTLTEFNLKYNQTAVCANINQASTPLRALNTIVLNSLRPSNKKYVGYFNLYTLTLVLTHTQAQHKYTENSGGLQWKYNFRLPKSPSCRECVKLALFTRYVQETFR